MIKKVTTLCHWLVMELKHHLPHGSDISHELVKQMVLLFHSLIDHSDQRAILTALENGSVCYIVATICVNVGINMMVTNIVCVDIPHSFEEMIQWAGHASHDGSRGMLVIYVSRDLKRVKEDERRLDTYIPPNEQ